MTLKIATCTHGYYVCELGQDYDTKTHFLVEWLNICFLSNSKLQVLFQSLRNHEKLPIKRASMQILNDYILFRGYRKMCTSHSDMRTLPIAKQNSLNVSKVIVIITFPK